jgi:predicted  nucleic acid-binding Zn-ribbon protein
MAKFTAQDGTEIEYLTREDLEQWQNDQQQLQLKITELEAKLQAQPNLTETLQPQLTALEAKLNKTRKQAAMIANTSRNRKPPPQNPLKENEDDPQNQPTAKQQRKWT